jgi:hypothetical protein
MMDLPPYETLLAQGRAAAEEVRAAQAADKPPDLRLKNTAIIGGSAALLGAYATTSWWKDGFTRRFRVVREGGFGADTEFSGMDKLGHVYSTYFASRALTPLFEAVGNSPATARRIAAWTAWGAMSAMEIGDGFSRKYRFSPEDFVANTLGALLGYGLLANPEWDDLIDFRLAYRPSPLSGWDPPGDYAGQRFHLVLKAEGVRALRDVPLLRYLEVGVGYGAPGVDTPDEWSLHDFALRRREVFAGVSLNLSRLLADAAYDGRRSGTRTQRVLDHVFELVQFPSGYQRGWDLDRYRPPAR